MQWNMELYQVLIQWYWWFPTVDFFHWTACMQNAKYKLQCAEQGAWTIATNMMIINTFMKFNWYGNFMQCYDLISCNTRLDPISNPIQSKELLLFICIIIYYYYYEQQLYYHIKGCGLETCELREFLYSI